MSNELSQLLYEGVQSPSTAVLNDRLNRLIRTLVVSATEIDISGITDINLRGQTYRIINLVSTSAVTPTETILTITNFPDDIPIRFFPKNTLTVTFVHGTGINQPHCYTATNQVIDGSKGEWIEFTKMNGAIYETNVGIY